MQVSDYASYDGVGLAELIRSGQVSAAEVEQAAREAIAQVDPRLGALVGELFEAALEHTADGPFGGVPFLYKDLVIHAAGVPVANGTRMPPVTFPYDSDLMARFRAAGLAALGRTATPEFGFNATTESVANGPTRNPWDTSRSSGGSSGGAAALVAARAVPVAHASDGGGSIRIPAASCGLVGLKPSRGRVPIGPDYDDPLSGFAVELAVTRTVRDAAALLDAVQGPGVGDRYVIAPPARPYVDEVGADPGRLRIATTATSWSGAPADKECQLAVEAVARELAGLGHDVGDGSPEVDGDAFVEANVDIWSAFLADGVVGLGALLGVAPGPDVLEAATLACVEHGRSLSALELSAAMRQINAVSRSVGRFFSDVDVLMTPTTATPAPKLGVLDQDDASLDAAGWTRKVFGYAAFTPLFNATGQPAISLPLGWTGDGRPVGVQLVGRFGAEDTLLRLAAALEDAMPWRDRRPGVCAG